MDEAPFAYLAGMAPVDENERRGGSCRRIRHNSRGGVMLRKHIREMLIAAAGVWALSLSPASAAVIDPFGRDGVELDPQEWIMIKAAIAKVLEAPKAGAEASWDNPPSGRAGQAKILRTYSAKGLSCAEVAHDFTKGSGGHYVLPFCQVADGSWKVAF
jgi:surface antigen